MSDTTTEPNLVVESHVAYPIRLPPTDNFPVGLQIWPGRNDVPRKYWDEMLSLETYVYDRNQQRTERKRYPGREQLEELTKLEVKRITSNGVSYGPRLTVFTVDQAPEGSPGMFPHSLKAGIKKEAAEKFIEMCSDRKVLQRWAAEGAPYGNLAKSKLNVLGNG